MEESQPLTKEPAPKRGFLVLAPSMAGSKPIGRKLPAAHTASDGSKFATHAYQNTRTGLVVEPKAKLEKGPKDTE